MAHDLTSVDIISRIFDFLLAHNPAMVSYLCAAIVMAKKEELKQLDPDVANDPATLHTVLSKLPPLTIDPPTSHIPSLTSRSTPSSPRQSFSATLVSLLDSSHLPQNFSSSSLASLSDPDIAYRQSLSNGHGSKHKHTTRKHGPISIEALFQTANQLYSDYPLDHAGIDADTIFGPNSAVYTWSNHDLSEEEAEKIVLEGTDVIIVETLDTDKDKLDRFPIGDKLTKRQRRLQMRYIIETVFVSHRQTTLFALVGIAGALLALYGNKDSPYLRMSGNKSWIKDNWPVRFVLGKL